MKSLPKESELGGKIKKAKCLSGNVTSQIIRFLFGVSRHSAVDALGSRESALLWV